MCFFRSYQTLIILDGPAWFTIWLATYSTYPMLFHKADATCCKLCYCKLVRGIAICTLPRPVHVEPIGDSATKKGGNNNSLEELKRRFHSASDESPLQARLRYLPSRKFSPRAFRRLCLYPAVSRLLSMTFIVSVDA